MPAWSPSWPEVLTLARRCNPHYSMTEREQDLLYEIAMTLNSPAPLLIELGVCNGKTAVILSYVAKALGGHYIGVDNWSLEGTRDEVWAHITEAGLAPWAELIQGDTHSVPVPDRIDLLLIDAGHQESAVSVDCERWIPHVRSGGLVAFDDYDGILLPDSPHVGVYKHAEKWTSTWRPIMFYGKLLIRRVP